MHLVIGVVKVPERHRIADLDQVSVSATRLFRKLQSHNLSETLQTPPEEGIKGTI